ncbi:MAG: hypothetical protein LBD20_02730 [Spirochaetaceae bacterium]|jgi:hypothetical protein|nr:hypothetical protein [Spirochaetaceae bacterium]
MKSKWSVLGIGIVIFAAGCLLAACAEEVKSTKKAPNQEEAALGELSVEPPSMALFVDGGEKRLTAVFSREASALAKVEWSAGDPDVAEIQVHGEIAIVVPKGAGNTTVTAKLVPRQEGVTLDMRVTEVICPITVISEFKLDNQRLLFFEGEAAQSLAAIIPESVLQVAKIVWTVEAARQGAIAITGEGRTVAVAASGLETMGIITAKLEALNEDAFNGTGRSAVCAVTSLEALSIEVPPASYMLNAPGQPERTSLITAQYGPGRIDIWQPEVVWTSAASAVARFEGTSSASLGRATTHITAASVGTAAIEAELTVAGRSVKGANQVQVSAYQEPAVPVIGITISPKPASVVKTERTALITATLSGSGGKEPSDPMVEWDVSETGVVEIIYDESSQTHAKVWLEGVWNGAAAKTVTVTARSHSNTNVSDTFLITVNPIVVTVTTSPAGGSTIITKGGNISLSASVNVSSTGNKNIHSWTSDHPNIVSITASGPGNTNATVVVQNDAVVTAATTVQITASADADSGVTSGSIEITINPHTFKITYNKNDGTAQPATEPDVEYTYGNGSQKLRTIAALSWTKADYAFRGWTFTADNEHINAELYDGASITALNSNAAAKTPNGTVTLYGKWLNGIYDPQTWKAAIDFINNQGSGTEEQPKQHSFNVTGDFELGPVGSTNNPVITAQHIDVRFTATVVPKIITLSTAVGHILAISDNQKITIDNIKLNYTRNGNTKALVSIKDSSFKDSSSGSAELVMKGSSSISGNQNNLEGSEAPGGGVYIEGGTLTMKDDASISHNQTAVRGGGVAVNTGTVTMQGHSSIAYNTAGTRGGGIAFLTESRNAEYDHDGHLTEEDFSNSFEVTMEGDSHISNNAVPTEERLALGGGIYGGVTMKDSSSIHNNYASTAGGGVFSVSGTTMRGSSTIHHNRANEGSTGSASGINYPGGGGLYVIDHSYMYDNARVHENRAGSAGGVSIDLEGIFIMTGSSKIDHNTSTRWYGGGVTVALRAQGGLGMGGGQISDNHAYNDSGHQLAVVKAPGTGGILPVENWHIKYGAAYFSPSEPLDLSAGTAIGLYAYQNNWLYNNNFEITGNGTQFQLLGD